MIPRHPYAPAPHDAEIDPAVVAAIVAILIRCEIEEPEPGASMWVASGKVAPGWCAPQSGAWRALDRVRGWRD